MGIDIKRIQHQLLFLLILPSLSIVVVYLLNFLFSPIANKWYFPLIDSLGVLGAYSLIFTVFDRYLWKMPQLNRLGVVSVPNLSGRWKGELTSSYSGGNKINTILEVYQTFSKIEVYLYTMTSSSSSIIAGFVTKGKTQELHYMYKNDPNEKAENTMHSHSGSVVLRYDKNKSKLDGYYYTEGKHERGSTGKINFTLISTTLEGRF